jgi:hypothetical protein
MAIRSPKQDRRAKNKHGQFSVEAAAVGFCVSNGTLARGQNGQMSSGDQFFEVTISSVERTADHLRVSGHAERKFDYQTNA